MAKHLRDRTYILSENSAWITIGGRSVHVFANANGVNCNAYEIGKETEEPLGQCEADFSSMDMARVHGAEIGLLAGDYIAEDGVWLEVGEASMRLQAVAGYLSCAIYRLGREDEPALDRFRISAAEVGTSPNP